MSVVRCKIYLHHMEQRLLDHVPTELAIDRSTLPPPSEVSECGQRVYTANHSKFKTPRWRSLFSALSQPHLGPIQAPSRPSFYPLWAPFGLPLDPLPAPQKTGPCFLYRVYKSVLCPANKLWLHIGEPRLKSVLKRCEDASKNRRESSNFYHVFPRSVLIFFVSSNY
jgi:hypothetical protein